MCILPPSVGSISPTCIGAGSFDVLTITGAYFGSDTGTVFFTNADDTTQFVATNRMDIKLWAPTEIQVLVPTDPAISCSGKFYVQTVQGYDNRSQNSRISINYGNYNKRNSDSTAEYVFLGDTPFVFQLDTVLFNTPGALKTIQHILADMNCQTGVNFQVDTTEPSVATGPHALDGINLISIQPVGSSIFSSAHTLAVTSVDGYSQSCFNNQAQYNTRSADMFGVDISVIAVPLGGIWLWSDSIAPDSTQFDFGTVIIHELGHAAMLEHTQPISRIDGNVMAPITPLGQSMRTYDNDPNDIIGIKHVLSLGVTLAASGCDPASVQVYPSGLGCPTVNPAACIPLENGIDIIPGETNGAFNAYLYPNPYQDNTIIYIDVSGYSNFTIKIYDVIGHVIRQINTASATSFDVPLSDFNESMGMYLIEVSDSHNKKTLKLVKL